MIGAPIKITTWFTQSGDYYFFFCQQSSLTLCYLQIQAAYHHKSKWLSAKTMQTSFFPSLKNIKPRKTWKQERKFWKMQPPLYPRAGMFARTMWLSSLTTCRRFIFLSFSSLYGCSLTDCVYQHRPSFSISNSPLRMNQMWSPKTQNWIQQQNQNQKRSNQYTPSEMS